VFIVLHPPSYPSHFHNTSGGCGDQAGFDASESEKKGRR
jgi:hypothetical protein